jgi:hypothetical protein
MQQSTGDVEQKDTKGQVNTAVVPMTRIQQQVATNTCINGNAGPGLLVVLSSCYCMPNVLK